MSEKYNKLMDQIELSDEAKNRISKNVLRKQQASLKHQQQLILSLACVLVLAIFLPQFLFINNPDSSEDNVQIVNPLMEYNTLAELISEGGIDLKEFNNLGFEVNEKQYLSIQKEISQITYIGTNTLVYRKGYGNNDISGYFDETLIEESVNINDIEVNLKSKNNVYVLAIWHDDTYSYSIQLENGISKDEIQNYVLEMIND